MINLRTTLEKIIPELELRLAKSRLVDWTGDLLITAVQGQAALSIERGSITVATPRQTGHAIEGGQEIAQLILGCEDPQETVEEAGITVTGDADELVGVLFPWEHPMMGDEAV